MTLVRQTLYDFSDTTDPTTSIDSTAGAFVGAEFVNTATGHVFVCTDATSGAAVWSWASADLFEGGITLGEASTGGIKLDVSSPVYGWRDMLSTPIIRGVPAVDPTWAVWMSPMRQYQFSSGDTTTHAFHMPHDYALGTDMHIHVHWSQDTVDTGGAASAPGDVEWLFSISYAKGHDQAAFSTAVAPSVIQTASTVQYQHMIAEVQMSATSPSASQVDTDDLEVDGLIIATVQRSTGGNDTLDQDPFVHFVDIHYQSTGIPTKNKAPDFYT